MRKRFFRLIDILRKRVSLAGIFKQKDKIDICAEELRKLRA